MNENAEDQFAGETAAGEAPESLMEESSPQGDGAGNARTEKDSLLEQLQRKNEESKKYYDLYLRAMAEMENMRKRSAREKEEYVRFATLPMVKQLLGVIDDLERALAMTGPDREQDTLYKGISMITTRLQEIVAAEGAEPLEAVGQPFDPQFHQPLAVEASSDHPENTVIEELQKGYIMHGRVIRPSLVKVSS